MTEPKQLSAERLEEIKKTVFLKYEHNGEIRRLDGGHEELLSHIAALNEEIAELTKGKTAFFNEIKRQEDEILDLFAQNRSLLQKLKSAKAREEKLVRVLNDIAAWDFDCDGPMAGSQSYSMRKAREALADRDRSMK